MNRNETPLPQDRTVRANGIQLHFVEFAGTGPTVLLLHGITANARTFDGLVHAGLSPRFRVLALDLRGRGQSDRPATGYDIHSHAADVIGLLDAIGCAQAVVCGHSFGGLVTLYLAAHYPERVSRFGLLDSAAGLVNPNSRELIAPSLSRLGKTFPSWEEYLDRIRHMPCFAGWEWDPVIEAYYRADVQTLADGSVKPWSEPEHMAAALSLAENENWAGILASIRQPALLFWAPEPFGLPGTAPVLSLDLATETVEALPDCQLIEVPGNHVTMLYGAGARQIADRIGEFVLGQ